MIKVFPACVNAALIFNTEVEKRPYDEIGVEVAKLFWEHMPCGIVDNMFAELKRKYREVEDDEE